MAKLLMITGLGSAKDLASGKKGAFYNTLEEFHKYWDRIDIIAPKVQFSVSNFQFPNNIQVLFGNVYIHVSPWPLLLHPIWFIKTGIEIYQEQKFDLMTVQEFPPFYNGIGARLLWHKIKIPYVLEIMHIPGYPKAAGFKEKLYRHLIRFFIKLDSAKAKAVRVINKKQTPEFLINAGVPKEKLHYIPASYIDLDIFRKIDVNKEYDLLYAARLEKNKGIFNLIKAVALIKKDRPGIKVLIIGTGPIKGKLMSYVRQNDLSDNVVFSGWLETADDIAKAYNSAKIFINPSLNEGGPRVVLEAMACGLPVITTEVGLMPDIIKDGVSGLFTDWAPGAMAAKINYLLDNPELWHKLSAEGLKIADQFEKKSTIKNYADTLKSLIQ